MKQKVDVQRCEEQNPEHIEPRLIVATTIKKVRNEAIFVVAVVSVVLGLAFFRMIFVIPAAAGDAAGGITGPSAAAAVDVLALNNEVSIMTMTMHNE